MCESVCGGGGRVCLGCGCTWDGRWGDGGGSVYSSRDLATPVHLYMCSFSFVLFSSHIRLCFFFCLQRSFLSKVDGIRLLLSSIACGVVDVSLMSLSFFVCHHHFLLSLTRFTSSSLMNRLCPERPPQA